MKQILIKLAALGLLFSVVSTYACDSCGCNKARESTNVHDVEGKEKDKVFPRTPRTAEEHTKTHRKAPKK